MELNKEKLNKENKIIPFITVGRRKNSVCRFIFKKINEIKSNIIIDDPLNKIEDIKLIISETPGEIKLPRVSKTKKTKLPLSEYFGNFYVFKAHKVLTVLSEYGYDINLENSLLNLDGGGISAQSEAANLAISKGLYKYFIDNNDLRGVKIINEFKFKTSDSRQVYPKMPGKIKSRKGPQRSKR